MTIHTNEHNEAIGYSIDNVTSVRFKTPTQVWEAELAAIAHSIALGVKNIECSNPVAFHMVRIRGLMTEATHPYTVRSNEVLKKCDIYSKDPLSVDYIYRANGNRGTIKFKNNEVDIDSFNRNVGSTSELASGYSTNEHNPTPSAK